MTLKDPKTAATAGFILAIPMMVVLAVITFDIQPFESMLQALTMEPDGSRNPTFGIVSLLAVLWLLPIGLVISVLPTLKKRNGGKRILYPWNLLVALMIVGLMVPVAGGFLGELYSCEILNTPNCD